jgi:hypothetical protein
MSPMTLSGIDSLRNKTILDPNGKYLTFTNTFTAEPDRAEALIQALKHSTEETFRSKKGFVSFEPPHEQGPQTRG